MIEMTAIEFSLERARQEQWTSEKVLVALLRVGDTKRNARNTFLAFIFMSMLLSGIIILLLFLDRQSIFLIQAIRFTRVV